MRSTQGAGSQQPLCYPLTVVASSEITVFVSWFILYLALTGQKNKAETNKTKLVPFRKEWNGKCILSAKRLTPSTRMDITFRQTPSPWQTKCVIPQKFQDHKTETKGRL